MVCTIMIAVIVHVGFDTSSASACSRKPLARALAKLSLGPPAQFRHKICSCLVWGSATRGPVSHGTFRILTALGLLAPRRHFSATLRRGLASCRLPGGPLQ